MNDFCIPGYDYSTREMREETVAGLFARAVSARSGTSVVNRYSTMLASPI